MPWSDEEFKIRVVKRSNALGRSMRQTLEAAGISHDALEKPPISGRRLDTLEKLAAALDWSLADIMGHALPAVTPELLKLAFDTAHRALRHVEHDEAALIEVTARIYNVLADRRRDGLPIDEGVTGSLAAYIASAWQTSR